MVERRVPREISAADGARRTGGMTPQPLRTVGSVARITEAASERYGMLCLDRNERVSPLPPTVLNEIAAELAIIDWTRYPNTDPIYEALCRFFGRRRDEVILTPGSDGALRSLFQAFVGNGDAVVTVRPSYAMYEVYAALFGADVHAVDCDSTLAVQVESIASQIEAGVKLVLIANPNQPTGSLLTSDDIGVLLNRAADVGALVVLDEAYAAFARCSAAEAFPEHPNLVVLQTFSKAWGLAGMRLGVALSTQAVIAAMGAVRSVYDITAPSAAALRVVLSHADAVYAYRDEVDAGREYLAEKMRSVGFHVFPTATNFMVIRTEPVIEPERLISELCEAGILIRGPFAHPSMAGCVRISLGPVDIMVRVVEAVHVILQRCQSSR